MSRTTTLGQGTLLGHFDANPELIPWREAFLALPGKLHEAEADARARGVGVGVGRWPLSASLLRRRLKAEEALWQRSHLALAALAAMEAEAGRRTFWRHRLRAQFKRALEEFVSGKLGWEVLCSMVQDFCLRGLLRSKRVDDQVFVHIVEGRTGRVAR